MIKKNFLHRNSLANKLRPIGFSLLVVCLCLLSGSCDNDSLPVDDGGSSGIDLQFSTSVDKLSSTADTRAIKPNGGVIEGSTFPQGDSEIGMFIKRNSTAGGDVFPGSADNMKAILTRNADGSESWVYTQKSGTSTTPESYVGKNIQIVAYWPYNAAATASGIPFDFTNISGGGQTELLYNKQGRQKLKIAAGGQIPLEFAHAYSWITLNIRKSANAGTIKVSSASVVNQSGTWIKNKGKINPTTGYPTKDSKSGGITDATMKELTMSAEDTKYEFLVPAFIDELVNDGNVGLKLVVDRKEVIFELKKEHLNELVENGTTKYGFRQGYKNSYELVYDNLTMSLQLRDWTIVKPEGDIGLPGIADKDYKGWRFNHKDIPKEELPPNGIPITSHLYETYLSDKDRGGNGVGSAVWPNFSMKKNFEFVWSQEPPRSPIEFAMNDVLATPIQWKDQNGILLAKQLCRSYREGGYSNWRLPRMAEWYMFEKRIKILNGYDYLYYPEQYGGTVPSESFYWAGTESTGGEVMVIKLNITPSDVDMEGSVLSYASRAYVRCVRDANL